MEDHSKKHLSPPESPPSIKGLFLPVGEPIPKRIGKSVLRQRKRMGEFVSKALRIYLDSVDRFGSPYPGWEVFERDLAFQFALVLSLLHSVPRRRFRLQLLELFLDALNLEEKRGRPRKAKEKLEDFAHGRRMEDLWQSELYPAWNMKGSLERAGQDSRTRLQKEFAGDVVRAVLSLKATPESSIAKVYSERRHISEGRARNALRAYQKFTGRKFAPHV